MKASNVVCGLGAMLVPVILFACVGDDPSVVTSTPDGSTGSPDGGGTGSGDAANEADGGDGAVPDIEPTPVGTFVTATNFPVDPSFADGVAKAAYASDGSLFVGFSFRGSTTILGKSLTGASTDIGVAKIKPDGTLDWARSFGGTGADVLHGLTVDGAGDVYVAGTSTSASITFEAERAKQGASAAYVAKLAGGDGAPLKSAFFDKATTGGGRCDGVAARGDVVAIACSMSETSRVKVVGGSEVDVTLPHPKPGVLLAVLTPSLEAKWTNALASSTASLIATGVAVTPAGDLVFGGLSSGSGATVVDKKSSFAINLFASTTAVVGKFGSAEGLASWGKAFGSATAASTGLNVEGIATDTKGDVVFCGTLYGIVNVGERKLAQTGGSEVADMAVAKLSSADGTTIAARAFGGSSDDYVRGIATDRWDNVLLTGRHNSTNVTIDGKSLPDSVDSSAVIFAVKMNPSLVAQWAFGVSTATGSTFGQGQGIAAAPNGRVAYIGVFNGTGDFGQGAKQSNNGGAGSDGFVVVRAP